MWMKWASRDDRRFIRRACSLVCVPFVALLVALQTGWLFEVTDKQGLLAIVGTVAAVVWFVPHIAVFSVSTAMSMRVIKTT